MITPRSWLFVPGDRPDRMEKALGSGADALILDLEDSVAESAKGEARTAVREFLRRRSVGRRPRFWVRINPINSPYWTADLQMVVQPSLDGVVLPKTESGSDVLRVADALSELSPGNDMRILPIATETPLSVFGLQSYREAAEHLAGVTWGAEDLSSAIGAVSARTADGGFTQLYEMLRGLCLLGAATADAPAIETVYPEFKDLLGLSEYARRASHEGFVGMMAIHPTQVPVINEAFSPDLGEVEQARRIVELFEANPGAGALALDGKMLDAPHLRQARRVLQRGEAYRTATIEEAPNG